jgi:hypothetical protein
LFQRGFNETFPEEENIKAKHYRKNPQNYGRPPEHGIHHLQTFRLLKIKKIHNAWKDIEKTQKVNSIQASYLKPF